MQYLGNFPEDATVYIPFNTFSSNDPQASVTITNLVDADIMVHKDGGTTQIATDGATVAIDYDSITGNHLVTIDTSAHADYAVGSDYMVRMEGTTVDGGTINAWIGSFSIENRFNEVAVVTWNGVALGTTNPLPNAAADAAGGLPISDAGGLDLDTQLAATNEVTAARMGALTDWINGGRLDLLLDAIKVVTDAQAADGSGLSAIPWAAAWDAEVQSEVNDALVALGLDHLVSAAVIGADVTDNSIIAKLVSASATADWDDYVNTTDSAQAIRDRGDAAWITGAGGSDRLLLADTTIATLASQTSFTLTAGSADDDAYNNCTIVIEDVSTATQKSIGMVLDYTGASKTVTLKEALAFTIATTDKVYILAENSLKSTVANRQIDVTATGAAGIDWGNIENKTTANALSQTDTQLVATTTTNTDMRGTDGANTVVPDAAGVNPTAVENRAEMDSNSTELAKIGTIPALDGGGQTIGAAIAKLADDNAGADFDAGTDSLQGIRDRGDAAWTTGAGGSNPTILQNTTIATLASQTSFTLTAGSADDDAYNSMIAVIEDSATATQKAVGTVSSYTGASKTVTLAVDPGIFTMAAGDTIDIIAVNTKAVADEVNTGATHNITNSIGKQIRESSAVLVTASGTAQAGAAGTITLAAGANANNDFYNDMRIVIVGGTGVGQARVVHDYVGSTKVATTAPNWIVTPDNASEYQIQAQSNVHVHELEANALQQILADSTAFNGADIATIVAFNNLSAAQVNAQCDISISDAALATAAALATLDAVADAIKVVTDAITTTGTGLSAIPWNASWDTEVQSEVTDALNAYDPPTNTEMEARTPAAAQLAYITAHADTAKPVTFTGGTTTTAVLGNVDGSAASTTDDYYNGRVLVFNAGTLDQQATDITDYVGSTKTATITAVTTAVTSSHTAILV